MAKSTKQIVSGFQRLYFHQISSQPLPSQISSNLCRRAFSSHLPSNPTSPNGIISRFLTRNPNPKLSPPKCSTPSGLYLSRQLISARTFSTGKINGGLGKKVLDKPLKMARSAISKYREAVGLHAEAFWNRNYLIVVGAGGVVVCAVLWRLMFGVASTFITFSQGMAKYGFLALAAAMVAFTGLYVRSRLTINPDSIYRIAMTKLNTSAPILEIMGAPLSGTDVRAYVMSGGGAKLKNLKMKFGGKRCFLIFPIRGSERKGLVSVEVKKKKGQYDLRLLAVDIPMASGPDQRIFLIGDEQEYKVGGGLISELRDPIVKAMAATKEFEDLDLKEDEEDRLKEMEEAERKHREEQEREAEEAERKHREEQEREAVDADAGADVAAQGQGLGQGGTTGSTGVWKKVRRSLGL